MKKITALLVCLIMCLSVVSAPMSIAASNDIQWEYVDSMDCNSRMDDLTKVAIAGAIGAELGGLELAKQLAYSAWVYLTGASWVTDETVIYYTVDQYRGLEYGGTGGYDKYYLKQVIKIYDSKDKNRVKKSYTKIMESFSPLSIVQEELH